VRVLVAVANFGPYRYGYLDRVLAAHRASSLRPDVVLHSDRPKPVPPGVRLVLGLPTADPRSLLYAHRPFFAAACDDYDLFVYCEDDVLLEERHLRAFMEVNALLPEEEVVGFVRYERDGEGYFQLPDMHPPFEWVAGSVRRRGGLTFARFGNAHSGCSVLTQAQLRRAVASGGYLVAPHATKEYGVLECGATDPYVHCGLTKVLCLSRFDDFLIHHLPNNYVGRLGTEYWKFRAGMDRLLAEESNATRASDAAAP
jgi:hypothetical protein